MRRAYPQRVPSTAQVVPGAGVNIVLKADQPTGRTVSGTVQDVLTRGNHPRGIKVRLMDGRVGRVQSLADLTGADASSSTGEQGASDVPSAVTPASQQPQQPLVGGGWSGRQAARPRYRDVRLEEGADDPPQEIGLDAYIVQGRARGQGNRGGRGRKAPAGRNDEGEAPTDGSPVVAPSQLATCPVCGTFEGDEAAVAHHVASHFDS
ncbi:hypothetical protein NKR23_g256 [Pleurostoma richardsiae]|uniref:Uncharacterized protein n=1 Tax=Pleurostoma richardsiae TaxID=41990 RepID=A0AA38RV66_9PEZI|nr:hypothetical protein NKR23_g256 [Pleurostoma richardsiae]